MRELKQMAVLSSQSFHRETVIFYTTITIKTTSIFRVQHPFVWKGLLYSLIHFSKEFWGRCWKKFRKQRSLHYFNAYVVEIQINTDNVQHYIAHTHTQYTFIIHSNKNNTTGQKNYLSAKIKNWHITKYKHLI